jgi:putative metallohydrolase (TIGR04338 family)
MTRDFQRSKVYAAERSALSGDPTPDWATVKEVQVFVNRITRTQWWLKRSWNERHRNREVLVVDGRGSSSGRAFWSARRRTAVIALPRWARSRWVVCHELAHLMTPDRFAPHGAEWAANYLALVRRWIGPDAADALEASFVRDRVKHRP